MPFTLEPSRLDAAELEFGARFPRSYRESMLRANGGRVEALDDDWTLYPIRDDSDVRRLKRTCNDVLHETREAREWPGFPQLALAIAGNGTGDMLVLLPGDKQGQLGDAIFWFDHETGEVQSVADDFAMLAWKGG